MRETVIATVGWPALLTIGLLVALALVLGYRLAHRDPGIRRARYGLFVERDRFDEEPAGVEHDTVELDPGDY